MGKEDLSMSGIVGYVIACAVLALVVGLAVRSIWKGRKAGGCTGDCAHCGQCGGSHQERRPRGR